VRSWIRGEKEEKEEEDCDCGEDKKKRKKMKQQQGSGSFLKRMMMTAQQQEETGEGLLLLDTDSMSKLQLQRYCRKAAPLIRELKECKEMNAALQTVLENQESQNKILEGKVANLKIRLALTRSEADCLQERCDRLEEERREG
jgi:hypothetical protein